MEDHRDRGTTNAGADSGSRKKVHAPRLLFRTLSASEIDVLTVEAYGRRAHPGEGGDSRAFADPNDAITEFAATELPLRHPRHSPIGYVA